MKLLEIYIEDVFNPHMDMVAKRDYYLSMSYSDKGVLVSANGLLASLGYRQRQKDLILFFMNNRLKPNIDVVEKDEKYGVLDYYITFAAASRIIAGCHNRIKADKTLKQIEDIYKDLVGGCK